MRYPAELVQGMLPSARWLPDVVQLRAPADGEPPTPSADWMTAWTQVQAPPPAPHVPRCRDARLEATSHTGIARSRDLAEPRLPIATVRGLFAQQLGQSTRRQAPRVLRTGLASAHVLE